MVMVMHLVSSSTPINLGIGRDIDLVAYGNRNVTPGRYGGVSKQRVNGFLAKLQGKLKGVMDEIGEFLSNLQFQCRHVYREVKSGFFEGVIPTDGILPLAASMLLQQQKTQAYYKNKEISVKWPADFFCGFNSWLEVLIVEVLLP
ncbi:unnamed protein product [Ilex paraguariensis]|uniref:Uncharacterized protein n=1 Tax=Ilex paraguariensis TaxID=185542 RepID=A0ABC8V1Z3_9AQUA